MSVPCLTFTRNVPRYVFSEVYRFFVFVLIMLVCVNDFGDSPVSRRQRLCIF